MDNLYYKNKGFLYKLDPRSKMLSTLILLVLIVISQKIQMYFVILFFLLCIIFLSKLNLMKILKKSIYFIPIFFIIFLFNIFFINVGEMLIDLGIIKIYSKSVIFTLTTFFQIFLLTTAMEIFTTTTTSDKIMKALNYVSYKKNKNSEFALLVTVSLQFVPIIQEEFKKIQKIQKSRGGNVRKEFFLIIIPLFRVTTQRVEKMVKIMRAKNFWLNGDKTEFEELILKKEDFIWIGMILIFSIFYLVSYFLF